MAAHQLNLVLPKQHKEFNYILAGCLKAEQVYVRTLSEWPKNKTSLDQLVFVNDQLRRLAPIVVGGVRDVERRNELLALINAALTIVESGANSLAAFKG